MNGQEFYQRPHETRVGGTRYSQGRSAHGQGAGVSVSHVSKSFSSATDLKGLHLDPDPRPSKKLAKLLKYAG